MATAAERQRRRRERLRTSGVEQVAVVVPAGQRERIRRIAAALRAGQPVSPRLIAALDVLRGRRRALAELGADHAGIFGSLARGDDRPDSDIDVVLSFSKPEAHDAFRLIDMRRLVVDAFGEAFPDVDVDVSFYPMMKPLIRKETDKEAVYAF